MATPTSAAIIAQIDEALRPYQALERRIEQGGIPERDVALAVTTMVACIERLTPGTSA